MINLPGTRVQKEFDLSSPDLPCHSTEVTRKGWKPWVWPVFSLDMRVGSSFIWTGAKRSRETHVEEGFSMDQMILYSGKLPCALLPVPH